MLTRTLISLVIFAFLSEGCVAAEKTPPAQKDPPAVPRPGDAVGYEREMPRFRSTQIAKVDGDELLAALDGGHGIEPWRPTNGNLTGVAAYGFCFLPVPPHFSFTVDSGNGRKSLISFSWEASLVYLPEGIYQLKPAAKTQVARVLSRLDDQLLKEVRSAPLPCVYAVSTVDDGGTLSGIARLFYGDARKWKLIFEANRATIKNPDLIQSGIHLTIPKPDRPDLDAVGGGTP